jgi:hypothetical protein
MSRGTPGTTVLLATLASGLTGFGAIGVGLIGLSEAAYLGAGGGLALMLLAGGAQHHPDALYPARVQLARFRRSGKPADLLLVRLQPPSITRRGVSRRCATAVSSVLRVTDGVSMVPSLGGTGLCAVVEADGRARAAIDQRLRNACGSEIRMAWASSPGDGVTLESLIRVAVDRLPEPGQRRRRRNLRPLPLQRLVPRSVGPHRESMRRAR